MAKSTWIGIDIGGTKSRFDLFNQDFRVLHSIKKQTPKEIDEFTDLLASSVKKLFSHTPAGQVAAIGIGFAGRVDSKAGVVRSAPNIPSLHGFSFKKALSGFIKGPVVLCNDVQAAMYGEWKLGVAVGRKDVIGIFLGTGIGGAIISNGKPHLGATGTAGNIGHYLLQPFGPLAGSERHGVLDEVASRVAIAGAAASFAAKDWAPHLLKNAGTDVQKIKSSDLAEAIEAGDKSVEELVRSRAQIIGIVMSNLVDFFNPEMVVLGGGLTDSMPKLIREEVAAGIAAHSTTEAQAGLRIVTSKLKGHAVTTGAAQLASHAIHREQ